MLVLLLIVILVAPLILGPLFVFHAYRSSMPRVVSMDDDAAYAPDLFRHIVWNRERELNLLGFQLLGCAIEATATRRIRYSAVFECSDHMDFVCVTAAFEQDRYCSPQKLAYTEVEIISRLQDGTWIVTGDSHRIRPGSYRVSRFNAGKRALDKLLAIHHMRINGNSRRLDVGIPPHGNFAALAQEALESQEIYDALARRDLMQDEETGELRPTLAGAWIIGLRHFGIVALILNIMAEFEFRHRYNPHSSAHVPESTDISTYVS